MEEKKKKLLSSLLLSVIITIFLFGAYNIGFFHGGVDATAEMFQFKEVCELNMNNYYFDFVEYDNTTRTCIFNKGNISYKVGNLIINTNETISFIDFAKTHLFLGQKLQRVK